MAKTEIRNQADERRKLKQFLTRYYRSKERQAILQDRLAKLRHDLQRHGNVATTEIAEIEARINRQAERDGKIILEIMDVLDLLPDGSTERTILELRHIDCKPWTEIQRAVHFTRTPCFDYYNRGLDKLLEHPEVHKRLAKDKAFSAGKNADV